MALRKVFLYLFSLKIEFKIFIFIVYYKSNTIGFRCDISTKKGLITLN